MKNLAISLTGCIMLFLIFTSCNTGTEKPVGVKDSIPEEIQVPTKIEFPSLDKLPIAANLYYSQKNTKGFIVLCHMAEFNKSEYREIAKKLFEDGYNCMAIDQRSGGATSGYENETYNAAILKNKPTGFLDAEQDIIAAVKYVAKEYGQDVILWGSSYSASLALKVGKTNKDVKAIIAFSPGEYFEKDSLTIKNYIADIGKPVFITSSRDEVNDALINMIDVIGPSYVTHYRPKGKGEHGSMALWDDVPDNLEYWKAVKEFLAKL